MSLLGTFLVRSGVLTSVHAFAVDPARGVFILGLLAVAIGGSLALYAWRAPALQGRGLFAPISREGALLLNNLLLATACATVLLGTLYPLLLEAVGGPKISVGAPYFNMTFVPLMVPLLIAIPIGSMLAWKRGDLAGVIGRLRVVLLIAFVALLAQLGARRGADLLAIGAMTIAIWVMAGTLWELVARVQLLRLHPARSWQRARGLPRASYAMSLAHFGVGVLVAGVTASSAWQSEAILVMQPGETAELAGYSFTLERLEDQEGPNYVRRRAIVEVTQDGSPVATLIPEKRYYPVEGQPTSEAGIDMGFWRDLYAVLGDPAEGAAGAHTMRIYVNPLVMWIWGGIAIMGVAGLISLTDRRHRVGAPSPARPRLAPAAALDQLGAPDGRNGRMTMRRLLYLIPVIVFGAVGIGLAVGLTRDPGTLPSALARPAGADLRAAGAGRWRRPLQRGPEGPRQPRQRVRVLVRALPGRASGADALGRGGRADLRHQLQGPARPGQGLARRARRSVREDRRRPQRPGRHRVGRLRRAGDVRGGRRGPHPAPPCRPHPGARPRADAAADPRGAALMRRWPMRSWLGATLLAACLLAPAAQAATSPDEILADPVLEERARALSRQLRCLVCQNQSIDDSDAELARDLRQLVRERLLAGDSDAEIIAFLTARYGDFVLLKPPVKPATWGLWFGPLAVLLIAGGGIVVYLRRRPLRESASAPLGPEPLSPEERARLDALTGAQSPDRR